MKLGVSRRSCAVRGLAPLVLLDGQGALGADELYPINAHALVKPNFAHEVIALYIHDHNMGGTLASFTLLLPFACALRPKGRSLSPTQLACALSSPLYSYVPVGALQAAAGRGGRPP